ncbi:hypothetical protein SAOR_00805 [Salinisphaera orenii MK-B5]|uniref:Uncharacterized protein n=1 Tax=Salinisphaera orenii MK-B5 TaxID=856730 RepID=A0A423PYB4_9GAMM|nr:hypothetical protein SAOR_00805 [Salinisphaera orenii MK-B5]
MHLVVDSSQRIQRVDTPFTAPLGAGLSPAVIGEQLGQLHAHGRQHVTGRTARETVHKHGAVAALPYRQTWAAIIMRRAAGEMLPAAGLSHLVEPME